MTRHVKPRPALGASALGRSENLRRLLDEVASQNQTTIDALALAAVLAQPWAGVVLSGAAQTDHLHANLGAFSLTWSEELADRLAALAEPPEQYWRTRSELAWN